MRHRVTIFSLFCILFANILPASAAEAVVPEPPVDSSTGSATSPAQAAAGTGSTQLSGPSVADYNTKPAAAASAGSSPTGSPYPFTLHGGVTHSEALPHVSSAIGTHRTKVKLQDETPSLATSTTSNTASATDTTLQGQTTENNKGYLPLSGIAQPHNDTTTKNLSANIHKASAEWFMIPKWMAGKWSKQGDLTVSTTDLSTGQQSFHNQWVDNKMDATWGHQTDAVGNFWHVNFLPSERDGQSDGKVVRFLTVAQSCEKTSPAALVTRTQYVVSESNFWNGPPVEMFQQESLNHYVPAANNPNQFMNISTNRVFTYQGTPVRDGHLQSQYSKLGDYKPVPIINGIDLKASLNDYLESHQLADLMNK